MAAMTLVSSDVLTPRESVMMQAEQEENAFNRQYTIDMKKLEIEQQQLEAKWASWLKIPITIILLPVKLVLGIGLAVSIAIGKDIPEKYWDLLR